MRRWSLKSCVLVLLMPPTAANDQVGFGILGTAFIARRLAWAIREAGQNLVAVGSRNISKAEAFAAEFGGVPVIGYEAVLDRPDVDIVYIPLPTALRTEWVIRSCKAGKHVLAEKPFAHVHDVNAMVSACASTQFMDATFFMHSDRLTRMHEGMKSIGELRRVSASMSASLISRGIFEGNIRADRALEPHGALGDIGWYAIRGVLWAFRWELPIEVHCVAHARHGSALTEVSGWATFAGGKAANFDASFLSARRQLLELIGTNKTLRVDDLVSPNHAASPWELRWLAQSSTRRESALETEHHTVASSVAEVTMVKRLARIAKSGVLEPEWPKYALRTTHVIEACAQAIETRAPVRFDDVHSEL